MLVIDASAALAIVKDAPGAGALCERLAHDGKAHIGAPAYAACMTELGDAMADDFDRFLVLNWVALINLERSVARAAADAFARYRGDGLTLDDCYSYALAKKVGAPLLTANPAFAMTDVALV